MSDPSNDLCRDIERAFGRDLPGESFDRTVLDRIGDGGGEHEISLAPPRSRMRYLPALAAAAAIGFVLAQLLTATGPAAPGAGAKDGEPAVAAAAGKEDVIGIVRSDHLRPLAARLFGVVKTFSGGYRQEPIFATADKRGRFKIEGVVPASGKFAVQLAALADGYAFASVYQLKEGGKPDPVEFELEEGDLVELHFVDAEGKPVPDVAWYPTGRKTKKGVEHIGYDMVMNRAAEVSDHEGVADVECFVEGDEAEISCRAAGNDWVTRTFQVTGRRNESIEIRVAPAAKEVEPAEEPADVASVPHQDLRAGGDENMRYFLIGPTGIEKKPPAKGFSLLVVLPGGDGGADFRSFVKRIAKNALDETWLVAEPVSIRWSPAQEIVWPAAKDTVSGMKFTTEEFIGAVVADVARRKRIDPDRVFALGWSSSGPALYAAALAKETLLRGAFIAMSVFKEKYLPPVENGKGRRFYILHSPDDKICPYRMATKARDELESAGADVEFVEYPGGHGWRGDVYGMMRRGIAWLTKP